MKYRNYKEDFDRVTDRSTIYSADDPYLQVDLGKLQARSDELKGEDLVPVNILLQECIENGPDNCQVGSKKKSGGCQCCCQAHCEVSLQNLYESKTYFHPLSSYEAEELEGFRD